jgi:hypothetical protein
MKTFSGANGKKLDRASAMACVLINLAATPGLGTIIAKRFVAGALQLLLAVLGFCLFLAWYYYWFKARLEESTASHAGLLVSGVCFFAAGWLGALWSSLRILREAKSNSATLPPKLDGTPG